MTMTGPRDFSLPADLKVFTMDGDTFTAPAVIPAKTLRHYADLSGKIAGSDGVTRSLDESLDLIADVFRSLLPGPPGERFVARLLSEGGPDDPPPIDLQRQAIPVMFWLLEQYGMRPTQPSSASAPGSTDGTLPTPNGGTGSTDGATPEALPGI